MRDLRDIRNKRFQRRRRHQRHYLLLLLVVVVIVVIIIFAVSKIKKKTSMSNLTPGNIYTQENKVSSPQEGKEKSKAEESKEDTAVNPESFTFYKVLNSKEGEIVPLTEGIPKPGKKEDSEIKTPMDEKMSEIKKDMDKNIELGVKKEGVYTVQVAAFSNESKANEVISRLKLQGYAPYLIKESRGEDDKRGRLYKVRVGRFPSVVDAQEVARVLNKNGYETYVIKAE